MSITVRLITAEDKEAWLSLFRDYIAFYEETVSDNVIELTWRRLLAQDSGMMALIAENETGQALGIAALVFHRSTWSPTCYCYLEDLFVSAQARRKGVGRALIKASYAEADRHGATRVYWATQAKNAAARQLYDAVGHLTEFVQYRR